jgi:uracil-DNA glycosylase
LTSNTHSCTGQNFRNGTAIVFGIHTGHCFSSAVGVFHRRIIQWMSYLFPGDKPLQNVAYTNMVKCTTTRNKVPSATVTATCVKAHLQREIDLWQPQLIAALGDATFLGLGKLGISAAYLPHPTHRKGNDYSVPFLQRLKERLR